VSDASKAVERPPRPSLLLGAAHLTALWALAFLQPMLALLGDNPEFFVARGNTTAQIIVYALALAFVPPLIGLLIEAVAARFGDLARWRVHLVLMALVGSALALQILKRLIDGPAGIMIVLAIALGVAGAFAYDRYRFPRSFMDILTPAPIVILLFFFLFSSTSKLILPREDPVPVEVSVGKPAPVVMVIFDELPTVSLLNSEDQIDGTRFPAFAELSKESTWYRNATGNGAYTPLAVPAILTGRTPSNDDLPIASDNPHSVFTLLGNSYRMNVFENATRVCPEDLCPRPTDLAGADDSLGGLFDDLRVVSAHLLLPESMRNSLPDVSKSFGEFSDETGNLDAGVATEYSEATGATGGTGETGIEPERTGQGAARRLGRALAGESDEDETERVKRFAEKLEQRGEPTLDVLHVEKPHYPWRHIPDGQRYSNISNEWSGLLPNDGPWDTSNPIVDIALQRHLLEVGYTDALLSVIMGQLKQQGLWNESTVIVTADHGVAFGSGLDRRKAVPKNLGQIASVPLFIKAPRQQTPKTVDRHVCAADILPELAGLLEIDYPWDIEECAPDSVRVVNSPAGEAGAPLDTVIEQRDAQFDRIERVFGTGEGWEPVYRFGQDKQLIGKKPNQLTVNRELVGVRALPDRRNTLIDYDPEAQAIPGLLQRGTVKFLKEGRPLAASINGRIEAVGRTFDDGLGRGTGYSILLPPNSLAAGYNRLELFLVMNNGRKLQLLYRGPDDPEAPAKPNLKKKAKSDEKGRTQSDGTGGGQNGS
jgi:hypothetical protein